MDSNGQKPTFQNIAQLAGVGTATVERVLNGRGGVRPELVEKVLSAARQLDYPRRLPERHSGILRLDVILVRPETTFFARLSEAFGRIAATLDPAIKLHRTFMDERDPAAIAARIASLEPRRAGLIVAVPDHDGVRAALRTVAAAKVPLVQIVTRSEGVEADYVGIDNYAAGRTAGLFLCRMQPRSGRVAALCHSGIYQVHRDRIRGLSDYFAEHRPAGLELAAVLLGGDDALRSTELLRQALESWPDLVGLYNAGGANAALSSVLRKHPRGQNIFFVGHELTERSAAALRDGVMSVVLDQAPEAQARRAVDMLLHRLGFLQEALPNAPIRFVTVTSENL
ncbi:LacI family DNA-binding transcriptional regulator [Rhizobium sp. TRM95111]|uniref:LacI family DNA-binding transcriptional regulator n=1 Tax=Rhizobium alarense TaxID=2846851 RepID=UPI001F477ABC|nr:LacI family DNA-binding transcriptional regulator [Rhizobium alarense]MCF3640189.1 LacI family DNA-binding transcriptional regulator [Rhizobium alarense]